MSPFTLDISGRVECAASVQPVGLAIYWSDLDLFTQGTGEAMARELYERLIAEGLTPSEASGEVSFRNWAPETLARIMEDCARLQRLIEEERLLIAERSPQEMGAWAWRGRQANGFADISLWPLTPYLGEDGKVCLREGGAS